MKIGSREIGPGHPTYIIGEVAAAHDGSVNRAHDFIEAIAEAGASAVKFQCHREFSPEEEWRVEPTYQAYSYETRYAYRKRTAFTETTYVALAAHCTDVGVDFLCSPFDMESFSILSPLVSAWKVASGQITNHTMLRAMADTRKPILISTGMSGWAEVYDAEAVMAETGAEYRLLQCTSVYPCSPDRVGLSHVAQSCDGLSDHSGSIYPSLGAVALGASIIEVHVRLSEYESGPDASSSVSVDDLRQLVHGAEIIRQALKPVDKDEMAQRLWRMRDLFLYKESDGRP